MHKSLKNAKPGDTVRLTGTMVDGETAPGLALLHIDGIGKSGHWAIPQNAQCEIDSAIVENLFDAKDVSAEELRTTEEDVVIAAIAAQSAEEVVAAARREYDQARFKLTTLRHQRLADVAVQAGLDPAHA